MAIDYLSDIWLIFFSYQQILTDIVLYYWLQILTCDEHNIIIS